MKNICRIFILIFLTSFFTPKAQTDSPSANDSIERAKKNRKAIYSRPRTASIMSAVVPGLGQIYNRKYWKLPIIYAGIGGFGYMFMSNNAEYQKYRTFLRAENDEDPGTINTSGYTEAQLHSLKEEYQKYRDFAAIGAGIIYILNIVDANVDAHLRTFDVSDDLSIQVRPINPIYSMGTGFGPAAGLTFKFIIR